MDIPWDMTGRMVLATTLGAAIGLERELHGHPAGLRTHILVSLGAAIAALVSRQIMGSHGDPGRVAAQVVAGVGFLGAGAIIREGASIKGLTTAASIWTTAMIGLAVGVPGPTMSMGVVATFIVLLVLWWLHRLEAYIETRGFRSHTIEVQTASMDCAAAPIIACVEAHGATVQGMDIEHARKHAGRLLRLHVKTPGSAVHSALIASIADVPGVHSVALD